MLKVMEPNVFIEQSQKFEEMVNIFEEIEKEDGINEETVKDDIEDEVDDMLYIAASQA